MGRYTAALAGRDGRHQKMRREDRQEGRAGGAGRGGVGDGEGVGEGLPPLGQSAMTTQSNNWP
jgi:hypothetical protein